MSMGRTFPTGVAAPILLESLHDHREVRPSSVIDRFQTLLHRDFAAALHFKPTGSSWINHAERWFGLITEQFIRFFD